MTTRIDSLPKAFIWRRLHSLTGLWLVLFLIEHMITNSQAALWLGDSGQGFVRAVNFLHDLPYLHAIEIALLGVPILIHGFWGVRYALTSKFNSVKSDGTKPYLKTSRNKAYTWQRITSWLLVVLLTMHIVKFRFLDYPESVNTAALNPTYFVTVSSDPGIRSVANRLGAQVYDKSEQQSLWGQTPDEEKEVEALQGVHLKENQVIVASSSFGTATLFNVRSTFKSPIWVGVYTLFVLSAVFHAFNGLWTSMLTWGWVIKSAAQTGARKFAIGLMVIIALLGLAAIWLSYYVTLKN